MEKGIRKVKITMDGIKNDVLDKNFIWKIAIFTILLTPLVLCNIYLFKESDLIYIIIGFMVFLLITSPLIIIYFLFIYYRIYESVVFKKGDIKIKKDTLVEIKQILTPKSSKATLNLLFSTRISKGKYTKNISFTVDRYNTFYKWSVNKMDGDWIGKIGDEYYLIFLGKAKEPSMIYNTKYFYIEGDENE